MNAQEAKGIADSYHKHHQYKLLELRISEAASKGEYSISWVNLQDHTKILLKEKGYVVSGNGEGINGPCYEINWKI